MAIDDLLSAARSLLGPVELVDDLSFSSRAAVARVRLSDGTTVVVKQPFEPDAYTRETEAMRTLPASVRPALLGEGQGVIATEDLGAGPSLADLLLGHEPVKATAALLAWAETLGLALAPTLGRAPDPEGRADEERESLAEGLEALAGLAGDLGETVPGGVDDDAESVVSTLERVGPWHAFCPSDTCPDNNRVLADGTVRLFDFEGAGWRHAAMEAAYCRVPFCTCWCVAGLPDGMTGRMESSFLAALSPPDPEAFTDVVAVAAVWHTLVAMPWFRRFVDDDRFVGPADRTPCRGRQYVYPRLLTVAAQGERLPALADLAGHLADRIVERWPEAATMPLYPAFRGAGASGGGGAGG